MGKDSPGKRHWGLDVSKLGKGGNLEKEGTVWLYGVGAQMQLRHLGGNKDIIRNERWEETGTRVYNRFNDLNAYNIFKVMYL